MALPPTKLRRVVRHALHMGADERTLFLLADLADGERVRMGPFDREALIGLLAIRKTDSDTVLLVDPESDAVRVAFGGYRDDDHIEDEDRSGDGVL